LDNGVPRRQVGLTESLPHQAKKKLYQKPPSGGPSLQLGNGGEKESFCIIKGPLHEGIDGLHRKGLGGDMVKRWPEGRKIV